MLKIRFTYRDFSYIKEFNGKGSDNELWFGLKDRKGVWKDCLYNKEKRAVFVYGADSDYLEEVCSVKILA